MENINTRLNSIKQTTEGFYPSLFDVTYNFQGICDIHKILKKFTNKISIEDKNVDIELTIDTTSKEFKELLKYLFNLKNKNNKQILGNIAILYYSKDGSIFYKRILSNVKFNAQKTHFDIFNHLHFDGETIHQLPVSFTFEKIVHTI